MMRRLPGVCLAALAVTLAVAPLIFAKPPDLPNNPTIVVAQPPVAQEDAPADPELPIPLTSIRPEDGWHGCGVSEAPMPSLRAILTSSLFLGVHPFMAFYTEDQVAADEPAAVEEPGSEFKWLEGNPLKEQVVCSGGFVEAAPEAKTASKESEASTPQTAVENGCCSGCCFGAMMQSNWHWCVAPEGCCCGALNQFGLCWMSWLADCWKQCFADGEKSEEYGILLEPQVISQVDAVGVEDCGVSFIGHVQEPQGVRVFSILHVPEPQGVRGLLQKPVAVALEGKPLSQVFDKLREATGLPIVIDQESLTKAGVASLDDLSVTLHVMHTPLVVALDLILRPYHLSAEVNGCVVCITAKPPSGEKASVSNECGSACPKCEALHAQYVARAKATRLMKACYQAVAEERFEKAADLARQAHQLDPARVEGDPLIYKMQLLAQKRLKKGAGKCGCPKSKEQPANHDGEDPPLSLRPPLPADCSSDVVPALDAVLTGKDDPPHE